MLFVIVLTICNKPYFAKATDTALSDTETNDEQDINDTTINEEENTDIPVITGYKLNKTDITIKYGTKIENALTGEYTIVPIIEGTGEAEPIQLTKNMIIGNYNIYKEGTYKVKVQYESYSLDFTIKVIDPIIRIELNDQEKEKIKKEYKYEEELELNEPQLTVVKLSGETKVQLERNMILNYNSKEVGVQNLNIQYKGITLQNAVEIEVKDYIVDIILEKPKKTTYKPEEELDLTGAEIYTLSASGKIEKVQAVTMDMISGYEQEKMGAQELTVTYNNFQKKFEIIKTDEIESRFYQCLRSFDFNN